MPAPTPVQHALHNKLICVWHLTLSFQRPFSNQPLVQLRASKYVAVLPLTYGNVEVATSSWGSNETRPVECKNGQSTTDKQKVRAVTKEAATATLGTIEVAKESTLFSIALALDSHKEQMNVDSGARFKIPYVGSDELETSLALVLWEDITNSDGATYGQESKAVRPVQS